VGDVTLKPEQDGKGRFVSGNIGGGRPKGARAKLGEAFLTAMQEDFAKHGIDAVQSVRLEKPDQYLKVIASILPKEIDMGDETVQAMVRVMFRGVEQPGG
jgi:hypothetical protein